jgi:type I restriction enzyme S subunit
MNSKQLLAHFHRLAEVPDAIPRLRRFILDLAVRGKLVPQDPKDEPAAKLLQRIQAEKERLVKEGKMKKGDELPPIDLQELSFELPAGWCATRLEEIAACLNYMREPINGTEREQRIAGKTQAELYPYYGATQQQGWIDEFIFDEELILLGEDGVPFFDDLRPKSYLITGKSWVNNHAHVFRGILVSNLFVLHCLNTFDYTGRVAGATRGKLNKSKAVEIPIPLPPLAEQRRIVAKVTELMGLCDRLEAAQAQREQQRDRLAAATHAGLSTPEPQHSSFFLRHFPQLTTRPDQIPQLRQTILNLAVRGKLLPQNQKDEPVSELLRRLGTLPPPPRYASRSHELIVGDCGLSIGDPQATPPQGWQWVPLVKIARIESGHTPSRNRPDWWGGDVRWIGLVDARIHHGGVIHETIQRTNHEGLANSAARLLPAGTVCFSRTASVGYVIIMGMPMATSQDFVNWVPTDAITSEWLQLVFIAEKPAVPKFSKGAIHQTIYYPAWLSMHISLPPLAEQRRIVAKVEELMTLCDQMETQLNRTQNESRRLLASVLHEALAA